MAIYRNQASAHNAVHASPIRFQFQHGQDGWTSRISQDASLEGLERDSIEENKIKESEDSDKTTQQTSAANENGKPLQETTTDKELQSQVNYPRDDSIGPDADAMIRPSNKWESNFLRKVLEKEASSSITTDNTNLGTFSPSFDPPQTSSSKPAKKRTKKSAQKIAEELAANLRTSSTALEVTEDPKPMAPVKKFELTVAQSVFNHQAYIERQGYYAGFNPDMRTIMAADLKGRVPLEGLVDCRLNKGDVPLRQRLLKKERARSKPTLRELWEMGRRERGEV